MLTDGSRAHCHARLELTHSPLGGIAKKAQVGATSASSVRVLMGSRRAACETTAHQGGPAHPPALTPDHGPIQGGTVLGQQRRTQT
jgi:hypothetical protein